jgi:hypothetical protein
MYVYRAESLATIIMALVTCVANLLPLLKMCYNTCGGKQAVLGAAPEILLDNERSEAEEMAPSCASEHFNYISNSRLVPARSGSCPPANIRMGQVRSIRIAISHP